MARSTEIKHGGGLPLAIVSDSSSTDDMSKGRVRLTDVHDNVRSDILALLSHNSLPFLIRVSGCPSATTCLQLFGGYCGKTMV